MPGNAVFANAADLNRYGGSIGKTSKDLSDLEIDTFNFNGWIFSSFHGKMIDSAVLESIQSELCDPFSDEYNMHIPPMIFGHDIMLLEKSSAAATSTTSTDFSLSYNSKDALSSWSEQHSNARTKQQPLQIIQVPYAKDWVERSRPSNLNPTKEVIERKDNDTIDDVDEQSVTIDESLAHRAWDWTFSSDYCGTVTSASASASTGSSEPYIISMHNLETSTVFDETFLADKNIFESTSSGIDFNMLRSRDLPILFYDEILLYQDDLEDCGEVMFDAKLRVMPSCWFLMARMFLRIDGVIVRIRESRYYHAFGEAQVHLEVTWKECAIGTRTADATDLPYPLQHCDINPSHLRDPNKLSQLVPVASQRFYHMNV